MPLMPSTAYPHPRIEYLFDESGGRGKRGDWPDPWPVLPGMRCGYAGGLGPDNVDEALEFVERHPDARIWLDMESGVRTNDWMDLEKVEAVCQKAWPGA